MHGEQETSALPRSTWVALHLAQLGVALWLLLGAGYTSLGSWGGVVWTPGDSTRRWLLAAFAVVLWGRMSLTALVLLQRRFAWSEAGPVIFATALYQWGFALLGAGASAPLDALDGLAVLAYVAGSVFNTGSELSRRAFKRKPEHAGKLYTDGFFALCRHPNYFGDTLWGIGWALATRNVWSSAIVAVELSGFLFSQIPRLDRYLEARYGDAYRAWARRTKRFIPYLY